MNERKRKNSERKPEKKTEWIKRGKDDEKCEMKLKPERDRAVGHRWEFVEQFYASLGKESYVYTKAHKGK